MSAGIGYIALADDSSGLDPETSVKLWVSPDMVAGLDDDKHGGWDWIADGYCVMRTSAGQHDGHPATTLTLADSDTQREVGRLVLRNDALRDARLEVTRQFETKDERDAFVETVKVGGTDEMKTIELDMVFEDSILDTLQLVTEGTTIAYRVVQEHGPGGGWPVIAFTGKDRELRKMVRKHWDMDADDVLDVLG